MGNGTPVTTRSPFLPSVADAKLAASPMPFIRGVWYFVDPTSGAATNDGLTVDTAFATFLSAYNACTSGAGDGIAILSRGTGTASQTTSYLTEALTFSKHGITVFGVSSETQLYGRARIANATASTDLALLITVSGSNNRFENVHIGNFGSDVAALGCVKITGNRNLFRNCHFIGAGHATPAAEVGAYDVEINGGQENTFERCTLGTDTIIRAAANGNIRFDTNAWRTRFYDCEVLSYSATAGKGAILFADATACDGLHVFSRCRFLNWNENGITASTAAIIGTKPNSGNLVIDSCTLVGWAAWGAAGMSGAFYVGNSDATASGAGGIATSV